MIVVKGQGDESYGMKSVLKKIKLIETGQELSTQLSHLAVFRLVGNIHNTFIKTRWLILTVKISFKMTSPIIYHRKFIDLCGNTCLTIIDKICKESPCI